MRTTHLALLAIAVGCSSSGESKPRPDTATVVQLPSVVGKVADSTRAPDPCPPTGKWAPCSFEKRLRRSGFVAKRIEDEAPKRAGFAVKPSAYTLGHGKLEVFIYDDTAALAKDLAGLDSTIAAPRGAANPWPAPPTLIRSVNLIAVFFDQTPRQAERLILAVTAGPPSSN